MFIFSCLLSSQALELKLLKLLVLHRLNEISKRDPPASSALTFRVADDNCTKFDFHQILAREARSNSHLQVLAKNEQALCSWGHVIQFLLKKLCYSCICYNFKECQKWKEHIKIQKWRSVTPLASKSKFEFWRMLRISMENVAEEQGTFFHTNLPNLYKIQTVMKSN